MKWIPFFLISLPLFGLPIQNPSEPAMHTLGAFRGCIDPCASFTEAWSLRVGFYGDYVFDRYCERQSGDGDVHKSSLFTNAGIVVFNLCDRFELFGTFGATEIFLHTPGRTFDLQGSTASNQFIEVETESDLSWSAGVRALLFCWRALSFGVEGQYFDAHPKLNSVRQEGEDPFYLGSGYTLKYSEWQIGAALSYTLCLCQGSVELIPYGGIKWSHVRIDQGEALVTVSATDSLMLVDLESRKDFGFAFGATLVGCSQASLTAEGRFGDEKALGVFAQIRI